MPLHKRVFRSSVVAAFAFLAIAAVAVAQPASKAFAEPIPFHGGRLTGFGWRETLRAGTMELRPAAPGAIFVSLRFDIAEPFKYTRGLFDELTLADEKGGVYRFRGWRTDNGWVALDDLIDPKTGYYLMGTDRKLPGVLSLHFEVPASVHSVVLHAGTATLPLTW